jgi:hypothetical protein
MASRPDRLRPIIPAQTDHMEENGGVIGVDIHRCVGGFFVFPRSTFFKVPYNVFDEKSVPFTSAGTELVQAAKLTRDELWGEAAFEDSPGGLPRTNLSSGLISKFSVFWP